ncbi:MAG TPA: PepSY-associated TM helix domain-containing protein [Terriglobia bacterium]|nr:PepSY-associated TM helix domain-containing protein [Terriglobia bacterium]
MKHIVRVITHWALLIHIYVSMAGFALTLLFAVTGLTLNHQDFGWSEPLLSSSEMDIPPPLLEHPSSEAVARHVQDTLGISSPLTDYHEDPDQIQATFAAPGKRTVVTIDRAAAKGEVEQEARGMLGVLDDLHKGFDSGRAWYWTIDIAAVLLAVSALTGMVTLISLRARRATGFIFGGLGVATLLFIYVIWVPH